MVSPEALRSHTSIGLFVDREGRWFHQGAPVEHPLVRAAFSRGIALSNDGRYVLRLGSDWCYVDVEGAPLQVLGARPVGEPPTLVELTLSTEVVEPLAPGALWLSGEVLHCRVASGLAARFSRAAQASLGTLVVERGDGLALALAHREYLIPVRTD